MYVYYLFTFIFIHILCTYIKHMNTNTKMYYIPIVLYTTQRIRSWTYIVGICEFSLNTQRGDTIMYIYYKFYNKLNVYIYVKRKVHIHTYMYISHIEANFNVYLAGSISLPSYNINRRRTGSYIQSFFLAFRIYANIKELLK